MLSLVGPLTSHEACPGLTASKLCTLLQFESIANFGAVIDRLGEFQEVLDSSAMSRSSSTDAADGTSQVAGQQSLIQIVDQPGGCPGLLQHNITGSMSQVAGPFWQKHAEHMQLMDVRRML